MKWIVQAANETPFGVRPTSPGHQKLLGFGFLEDTKKKLITIGDVAAGTAPAPEGIDSITRALGQMQASRRSPAKMMQLTEAGIPAWKILAKDGHPPKELMAMAHRGSARPCSKPAAWTNCFQGLDKTYGGVMGSRPGPSAVAGRRSRTR